MVVRWAVHDPDKQPEDLEDRFVKLHMVNQERKEQLERQEYQNRTFDEIFQAIRRDTFTGTVAAGRAGRLD